MRLLDELRRRWWLVVAVLVVVALLLARRVATLITDILWYRSLNLSEVFSTILVTRVFLAVVAGAVVAGLIFFNLTLARRLAPSFRLPSPQEEAVERYRRALEPVARPMTIAVALGTGLLSGLSVNADWTTVLLWLNAVPFGREDPQFGLDLSFFVFELPFYEFLTSWLFTTLLLVTALTAATHYVFGGIRPQSPGQKVSPQANVHLSLLAAALIAVRALGFWLDRYLLSYSESGVVTGLSYTDVHARLAAYLLLSVIAVVCVGLFLANVRYRNVLLPGVGLVTLVVAAVALSGVYPAVIQRLQVDPQELAREESYIARNLELTRFGYGLEIGGDVSFAPFEAAADLEPSEVANNADTLESIRLWDPTVLSSVYRQLQGLRQYFDFNDVDVDRYDIAGEVRQVNLGVRELDSDEIPQDTWQNRHLVYTHGFGVVGTDVNETVGQGEPVFLIEDIPPTGVAELEPQQPRIYFGEDPPLYSVVGTETAELSFGASETDERAFAYDGRAGVGIGDPLRRLAFALRFAEPNLVLSSLLTDESRVLFNRSITERVQLAAPFLELDSDPYAAVVDGRVVWIQDAYTTSNMLPYSQRNDLGDLTLVRRTVPAQITNPDGTTQVRELSADVSALQGVEANYIRNSVKAVVDAYDGTVTLYVIDPDDPLIRAWRQIFPSVFTDGSQASEEQRAHFRYPEDLLRIQASVFTRYHLEDPAAFYTADDAWEIPGDAAAVENLATEQQAASEPPLRPYYLHLRLPGEDQPEFALIQPFNPRGRPNLIAWMAARSDPDVYGQLRTYVMPASQNVEGTLQVQARINQDREIAEAITLLNQSGARVIYGNLVIVPVGDSLLYAQPLFARAEQGQIPELRYVVLVFGNRVVATPTLEESLVELFGAAAPVAPPPGTASADETPPAEGRQLDPRVAELISAALQSFADADAALRDGDLAGYQQATNRAADLLREAQELTGGEAPAGEAPAVEVSPAPAPS